MLLQTPEPVGPRATTARRPRARSTIEVRRIIDEQRERVAEILAERKEILLARRASCLSKETITGDELRSVINEHKRAHPTFEPGNEAGTQDGELGGRAAGTI